MATRLKPVDAVTIGVGLTGSLVAHELTQAGLKVVGLERGSERNTVPDFQAPGIHDELRFAIRKANMQDNVREAVTFRNTSAQMLHKSVPESGGAELRGQASQV